MENTNTRSLCDIAVSHNDLPDNYIPYEWVTGGECAVCRKPFEGMHLLSQKTCGPSCRKRLQRLRASEAEVYSRIMSQFQIMRGGIKRRENVQQSIEQLKELKAQINDLLQLAGDDEELSRRTMLEGRSLKRV